jgi:hypothetical protein
MSTTVRVQLDFQGVGGQSEYLVTGLAFKPLKTIFTDRFGAFRIQYFFINNLNFDGCICNMSFF